MSNGTSLCSERPRKFMPNYKHALLIFSTGRFNMQKYFAILLSFLLAFVWYQSVSAQEDETTVLWYKFDVRLTEIMVK